MLTRTQMEAMLAWPGTYGYICDIYGEATYTHTACGPVLHKVTAEERAAMIDRAVSL